MVKNTSEGRISYRPLVVISPDLKLKMQLGTKINRLHFEVKRSMSTSQPNVLASTTVWCLFILLCWEIQTLLRARAHLARTDRPLFTLSPRWLTRRQACSTGSILLCAVIKNDDQCRTMQLPHGRSQDFCCGVQSVGKLSPPRNFLSFFRLKMEYSSAFLMHNDYNSRILSPQTKQNCLV